MKLLCILAALLVLPISPKAETICVMEYDTVWLEPGVIMMGSHLKFYPDTTRYGWSYAIDTIPHWIDPSPIWECIMGRDSGDWQPRADVRQSACQHRDEALAKGVRPRQSCPRVDTVIVRDTVCPCDHYWQFEYVDEDGDTTWSSNISEPGRNGFNQWINIWPKMTGNSRCIYCGTVRQRKDGK